jgi:hypothetical protein
MFMAVLGAAFLAIPLLGQVGGRGGMAMGGARGGYVAQGGGLVGSPRGVYWGGGVYSVHGPGVYGFHGHYPYYPGHYPYFRRRYPRWGYRGYYGYPSGLGWYGGAGVAWSDASYSYPAESDPAYAYAPPDNSSAYVASDQQQQIDELKDEVARLRAERVSANPVPEQPAPQMRGDTVLLFRDHRVEQIQNYAIVSNTLWVFTQQRARKIPIAELDIPATTKANADRGIDFHLPAQ